jgi:hypothetical protein
LFVNLAETTQIKEFHMKLVSVLILAAIMAVPALADYPLGVGLHGGYDMPVIQQDVGAGPVFGFSVRGNIVGPLHGQIVFRSTSQADVEEDIDFPGEPTLTIPGGTLTGFGLNALLAAKNPRTSGPISISDCPRIRFHRVRATRKMNR